MDDVARVLSGVLGRTIRYVDPSDAAYRQALEANGLPPALAGMFTYLYAGARDHAAAWAAAHSA